MSGPIEPLPPSQQRISDTERHQVAEILRQAAGDGRIDLDELDERLEATYAARTYADLVPITHDLPVAGPARAPARPENRPAVVDGPHSERGIAIMGGFERKGVWTVPEVFTVLCVMGGAEITVNEGTRVVVEGVGIMGGYAGPRHATEADDDPHAPVVRIRGVAIMGGVNVSRKRGRGR